MFRRFMVCLSIGGIMLERSSIVKSSECYSPGPGFSKGGEQPMTIIVGIICKDGVVIASDSQAGAFKGVEVKRLDYTKIYDYTIGGTNLAITGAGEVPFIARAVELFEEKTAEKTFHKPREIADLAEDVMNDINKRYVVQRMKDLGYQRSPAPKAQGPGETLGFSLMLGVCCTATPILY